MSGQFRYEARGRAGRLERGYLTASSREDALARLHRRHLTPLTLKPDNERRAVSSLSDLTARDLSRTLAQLQRSGLSFAQALKFASEELAPAPGAIAARMLETAEAGDPASQALEEFSGPQARLLRGVILAGETSGRLADALELAAASFTRSAEMRARIGTALIYPSFVIVATIATLGCFMLFVVPNLAQAFAGSEDKLPVSTRQLLALSAWLQTNGAMAGLIGAAALALCVSSSSIRREISSWLDGVLISPLAMGVALRLEYAAFASLASLSLDAGVPSGAAFDAAAEGVRNGRIRAQMVRAVAAIRMGERPSEAIGRLANPPKSFVRLMHVGEETGRLADALKQAGALLAAEAEQRLERLGAIAGPIVTLGLGLVVASVVMSLFLGLLAMSDLAGT